MQPPHLVGSFSDSFISAFRQYELGKNQCTIPVLLNCLHMKPPQSAGSLDFKGV